MISSNEKMSRTNTVTKYIDDASPAARPMLHQLRAVIKTTAPKAKETISYRIPFYEYKSPGYKGRLIYFAAFASHVSVFIVPRHIPPALAKKIEPFLSGRATLQFPFGTKIPVTALKQLIRIRQAEIDADLRRKQ